MNITNRKLKVLVLTVMLMSILAGCVNPGAEDSASLADGNKTPQIPKNPVFGEQIYKDIPTEQNKAKVILDCDMGIVNDDARGLYMMLSSGKVDVLGITTVIGNTYAEEGAVYALRQLELLGRTDIEVYQGLSEPLIGDRKESMLDESVEWNDTIYAGAFGHDRPESYLQLEEEPPIGYPKTRTEKETAVEFIVKAVKENPGEITLLATGSCTNIAVAVQTYPEIVPMVKQIIYMGGAFDVPGNTTQAAEFNWWADPEAAKICLRTPFERQLIVPLDVCNKTSVWDSSYSWIYDAPETEFTKMYREFVIDMPQTGDYVATFIFDEIAVAVLLDPTLATKVEKRYVDIDTTDSSEYGRSLSFIQGSEEMAENSSHSLTQMQECEILLDIDVNRLYDMMEDLLTRPLGE